MYQIEVLSLFLVVLAEVEGKRSRSTFRNLSKSRSQPCLPPFLAALPWVPEPLPPFLPKLDRYAKIAIPARNVAREAK